MNLWYPPILMYHRIHPDPSTDTPAIHPTLFERQISHLAKRFRPLPLKELVETLEQGRRIPSGTVVVTFDDGTEDNFTEAFPVLKRYEVPATIFLIAENVGREGLLKEEQIRQMQKGGIDFGSHTLNHAYLPDLPLAEVDRQLRGSKERLEKLGLTIELLSYPAGGFTSEILKAVRAAGYRGGCTTNRGFSRFPIDRLALRRISMHGNAKTGWGIWLRASGFYGLNRRLRHPYTPALA